MTTNIGTGATVAFADSSFTAELLSISGSMSRQSVQSSHMGTTGNHTKIPTDLVDRGQFTMEVALDGDEEPPIGAAPEVITVTFPLKSLATPASWVFTGFLTGYDWNVPLEEKMTATLQGEITGAITFNAESV